MAKLDSVIRHSITAPAFDRTKLHRERLVDEIHANVPRKLIAIAAPPGYGKTTLLADFTANTDLPVCWVRLTEADRDVIRFVGLLAASLKKRFRRLRDQFEIDSLSGSAPEAIARVFADIIDSYVSETFAIVLDDIHLINSSKPTIKFIDSFLEVLPEQLTFIASGREVIEVSLARLMAEGDLGGLGPHDLALTKTEVIALARQQSGLALSEDHADRLLNETKGWITGMLLSGELSGKDLPSLVFDARPMVYEYLASVVLNRQPDGLRRFMLDSSVFPVMTVSGCDEVLERKDSNRFLTRLVKEGLFLSATHETPRTYEYHPQFREFLLESLEGSDHKRLKKLRVRAASYLEAQDSIEHAVELYCDADAAPRAAKLADRQAQEMFWQGRWQTLESWADRLEELGEATPKTLLHLANYYTDQGELDSAEESLSRAQEMFQPGEAKTSLIQAEIVWGRIARQRGKFDDVIKAVENAEELMSKRGSRHHRAECIRLRAWESVIAKADYVHAESLAEEAIKLLSQTNLNYSLAQALLDLSYFQTALGKAPEAHASGMRAHQILQKVGAPLPLAVSYNNLAFDSHIQGEYQEALELYNEALKCARQAASPAKEASILFGLADLFADMDLALQAAELYGQGLNLATRIDDVDRIRYGCIQTSVLHRRRGGDALSNEWLRRALALDDEANPSALIQMQVAALEMASRPDHARETLSRLVGDGKPLEAGEHTLMLYFLTAANLAAGDLDGARNHLEEALVWAGTNGTEQILAGELAHAVDIREFARSRLSGNPVLAIVFRRIETMRGIAQQYQESPDIDNTSDAFHFFALGQVDVQGATQDLADLKPLPREVLFFLLDNDRVERDVLLESFWPHHPPGRQVANLHTAIYSLRRLLGREAILHEGSVYALDPERTIEYDVARFEGTSEVADRLPPGDPRRMFALTEAINSYGGPFLPEFSSDWVLERRRELELRYLDLLALHAQEALVRDQPSRALETLRQALELDPYRDDTNLRLLEALGRLGRRSEVVDHYQRYVRLLADELGLDPPEQVRELYTRLIG